MSMIPPNQSPADAPAQLTFTTNVFASPTFLGPLVALIASIATSMGVKVLDDPALQQQLILVLGVVITGALHYWFPGAAGRLGIEAPMPWNTPGSQPVAVGASVVTVAAPKDAVQISSVQPLSVGVHTVEVAPPAQAEHTTPASVTVTKGP